MNDLPKTGTTTNESAPKDQPAARPWVKPTFDRMDLKEAMATKSNQGVDNYTTYS